MKRLLQDYQWMASMVFLLKRPVTSEFQSFSITFFCSVHALLAHVLPETSTFEVSIV
jgi:hypothetical protein